MARPPDTANFTPSGQTSVDIQPGSVYGAPMAAARHRAARPLTAWLSAVLLGTLVMGAAPLPAAAQGQLTAQVRDRFQSVIDAARTSVVVPGISAAVITPDDVWTGTTGYAALDPKVALGPDTPFSIGSVTKTFVATVVLQLRDAGKLALSDHLSRWETKVPNASRITVRELLDHTSGVRDMWWDPHYHARVEGHPDKVWSYPEVRAMIGAPRFAPGTRFEYSNSNYVLLGRIVQRVTGHSIAHEIRVRLLDPLGLGSTWYQGLEPAPVTPAMGYIRASHRWIPEGDGTGLRPTTSIASFFGASGAMMSTPRDLATWARALYGGRVLRASSLAQMTSFDSHDYGLGARLYDDVGGRDAWGHGGSLDGFETSMWYLPSLDSAVVVIWNRREAETDPTADRLARRLINALDPDTTPPTFGRPSIVLRAGATVAAGQAPVTVSWPAARDSQSHLERYEVRQQVAGGPWRPVMLDKRLARSVALSLPTDTPTTVQVRAIDAWGNTSPWAAAGTVVPRFIDEGAAAVTRGGGWYRKPERDALGGAVLASVTAGSRLRLTVEGLGLAIVAPRGRVMGQANVRVDAGATLTLSLRATARAPRSVLAVRAWGASSDHVLRVSVRGTARPRVEIDGFLVLGRAPSAP